MQSVNDRWYALYYRLASGLAVCIVVASGLSLFVPSFQTLGPKWGLTYISLGLALLQLAYAAIYKRQVIQRGVWTATFVVSLLQALTLLNLIQGSGKLHSWYLLIWGFLVFFGGIFGTYTIAGYVFMVAIYSVLQVTDNLARREPLDIVFSAYALGGSLVIAVISHMAWRTQYKKQENQKLAQLSGMIANKTSKPKF